MADPRPVEVGQRLGQRRAEGGDLVAAQIGQVGDRAAPGGAGDQRGAVSVVVVSDQLDDARMPGSAEHRCFPGQTGPPGGIAGFLDDDVTPRGVVRPLDHRHWNLRSPARSS